MSVNGLGGRLLAALGIRPRAGGRDPLGPRSERAAERYLRRRGYQLLGRNVRTRAGEADLVMVGPDRRTVVIVEVKSRRLGEGRAGSIAPEAAVTRAKAQRLVRIARWLSRANGWQGRPLRIDVVGVEWAPGARRAAIRHHPGAVSA